MALTSTSTLAEVPQTGDPIPTSTLAKVLQTGDPIPTPQHATTSTEPNPSGPTVSGSTPTPDVNAIFNKRYQHKAKMEPRVAITVR